MSRRLLAGSLLIVACGGAEPPEAALIPASPIPGQPSIPYPPSLFNSGIEGEVMLYLVVDTGGRVVRDSSHIAKSSGHNEFDAAALDAAPGIRFTPAQRGGENVQAPIQVPIRFTIPDSVRRMIKKQP